MAIFWIMISFPLLLNSGLTFQFIGNEAFAITDGNMTLLTDFPYKSGAFGYMEYDSSTVQLDGNALLLITHSHLDHFDPSLRRGRDWSIIGPLEVTSPLRSIRVIPMDTIIYTRGIKILPFRTPHANIEHYSYRVDWGDVSMFFVGDTEDPSVLLAQKDLDYAFVTPWLWDEITSRGQLINAQHIVIYHHRLGEVVANSEECWVPLPGETLGSPPGPLQNADAPMPR